MSVYDRLAQAAKRPIDFVEIGGERFHVTSMSSADRAVFNDLIRDQKAHDAEIAAFGLCEPDGTISVPYEKAVESIKSLDGEAILAIAEKVLEISGLKKDSVDNTEKKSEASQTSSSDSGSLDT